MQNLKGSETNKKTVKTILQERRESVCVCSNCFIPAAGTTPFGVTTRLL